MLSQKNMKFSAAKENDLKHKLDKYHISKIINDKNVSTLIRQLRIPFQDDSKSQMMSGMYSLASYVRTIVQETLQDSSPEKVNLPVLKENIKENMKDEYQDSDEIDDDENLDHVELDMTTPNVLQTREIYQNKISKSQVSPSRRARLMMSPVVKAAIQNTLSNRIISPGMTSQMVQRIQQTRIDSQDTDSPLYNRNSSFFTTGEVSASENSAVQFNSQFKESHSGLAFVQHMQRPAHKKWLEMKTELQYNQKNIHILIVDDSVNQIESI